MAFIRTTNNSIGSISKPSISGIILEGGWVGGFGQGNLWRQQPNMMISPIQQLWVTPCGIKVQFSWFRCSNFQVWCAKLQSYLILSHQDSQRGKWMNTLRTPSIRRQPISTKINQVKINQSYKLSNIIIEISTMLQPTHVTQNGALFNRHVVWEAITVTRGQTPNRLCSRIEIEVTIFQYSIIAITIILQP